MVGKTKNHHYFSILGGALCKKHSECNWPMSLDLIGQRVIALDYDSERTWSKDPIIKIGDILFPNRKSENGKRIAKTQKNNGKNLLHTVTDLKN